MSGGGGAGSTSTNSDNTGQAASDSAVAPALPGATSNDLIAQAGEPVTTDGLTATSAALAPGDATLGRTLCTTASLSNGTDGVLAFNGMFDWKMQDPNGTILMPALTGSNNMLSAGEMAPGGKATGDVCFDAPQGSPAGQYVVFFDPAFRFTGDRIAWLNPR